ncbi:circadian clock KaiB family protein [Dyadobacter sp. CY356]|uniref:circadian clock KaiB family protein n=1 Tax=Dyadobacter sp. CY356 TaxID=2906442 RepID=UPI001F2B051F|nr:circadian clock KaiB family protein [Dyadobacter sp. CY356]MCF0057661.1 circadian clock KaiB family protein [Dyadobacter sp. CY356]
MNEPSNISDNDDGVIENERYALRLFVTGASTNSLRAISNIREICEKYLIGNYSLEIIDVYQQKDIAEKEQIIALPLLIKSYPFPERRLIGDMSDTQKVLKGLGLLS